MHMRKRTFMAILFACAILFPVVTTQAHNPGYVVPSPGVPGAIITIDGTETAGEWTGSTLFNISDYGGGNPLSANVKALHKADGIYLLIVVSDAINNNNDTVQIRFDINHSGGAMPDATDWGIEVRRNGQATWGLASANPGTWGNNPPVPVGVTSGPASWTAEVHLPSGVPSGLDLGTGTVGIHFILYDIDQENGTNSARYTQWPQPSAMDINALLDNTPNNWGNYVFDPTTTFPNLAITGVRRKSSAGNYYLISTIGNNDFEVRVNNPGGTLIPDASNVRINLYLAARGLNEPWHRLDTDVVLDGDCSAPTWASTIIAQNDVCSVPNSLDDISTKSINDIVSNTAKYTIKDGTMRLGGLSITVPGGTNDWFDVLRWDTTGGQDPLFTETVVNGMTYRRQHACMKAEAIIANDPNLSDNVRQVNMDFVSVMLLRANKFFFSLGWAGFGKYDPDTGKEMFLQVIRHNMDEQSGWKYQLAGVERLREDVFVAKLRGKQSLSVQLGITAPSPEVMGKTLKENLIVPPKAGGLQKNAKKPSGDSPVYVKVETGSTVLIANYSFSEKDEQYVDLDGKNKFLPRNGPGGLPASYLVKILEKVGEKYKLLTPNASLGALVGSFDNFRTSFPIDEGVQVKVPEGAGYLALGINDLIGLYKDNTGTGFRVKITQLPEKRNLSLVEAMEEKKLQVIPISEVMPTLCINGYEDIGQTRTIGGKSYELYRYIGNVCWGIINVYPKDRPEKPDRGDPWIDVLDANPEPLKLRREEITAETVVVTSADGLPVAGILVTATVTTGKKCVVVSPSSKPTDAKGKAVFTITATTNTGKAEVIFEAEGLKDSVSVKVKK